MKVVLQKDWAEASVDDLFLLNPKSLPPLALDALVSFMPMKSVEAMTGHVQLTETRTLNEVRKGYTQFVEGDLLLAKITPCMENGKVAVARNLVNGVGFGSTEFHVMRPVGGPVLSIWGFWYFLRQSVRRTARRNMTGSAGQLRVPIQYLRTVAVPLPPLVLQRAIVAKIEALLSELDKGVEQLQAVARQLKRYRQAVLKNAFEGKLSAEWRAKQHAAGVLHSAEDLMKQISVQRDARYEQQLADWKRGVEDWEAAGAESTDRKKPRKPVKPKGLPPLTAKQLAALPNLPAGWVWCRPTEVCSPDEHALGIGPFGSNLKVSDYTDLGVPLIFVRNITRKEFGSFDKYVSVAKAESLRPHQVLPLDILITKMGDPPGDVAIYPEACPPAVLTADCVKFRCWVEFVSRSFMATAIESDVVRRQLGLITKGVAQKKISLSRFKTICIPLPCRNEQDEIAQEIDSRFSVLDELETAVTAGLKQAEALRESILKKAFEGRLLSETELAAVQADPAYEPAQVLLERIRAERERDKVGAKRRRKAGETKTTSLPKVSGAERFKQAAFAAYAVKRLASRESFGRVQQMKLVYLIPHALAQESQVHARREAAGPLDPAIHKIEGLAKRKNWFTTRKVGQRYVYQQGPKIDEAVEFARMKFGDNADRVDWLLDQFARFDTERAELLATTFAVWNDHLIDGHVPSETEIVAGVRGWHPGKAAKFSPDRIAKCIQWMKDNRFVPAGLGPKTTEGMAAE